MLSLLAHASASDLILAAFVAACGLLAVLPELLPGKERGDEDEPPDSDEGRDDVLLAA